MKIFLGAIATETNTLISIPTGAVRFVKNNSQSGRTDPEGAGPLLAEYRRLAEQDGHQVVDGLCCSAKPLGPTVRTVYEALRDQLLGELQASLPVDAVMLYLHGAMVAEGYPDCEGDLLARIRRLVGPKTAIGVELDLHCHFTDRMHRAADIIICYKEYPHVDGLDRAREVYRITMATARGEVQPVTAVYDCKMVGFWNTMREPMTGFVKRMRELEELDGILSISFGHGFPWGDVPESGAKIWVIADQDGELAAAVAQRLGRELWSLRDQTRATCIGLDAAIDLALQDGDGPCVLADIADNPGGGAAGDSTFILRRLVERKVGNAAVGLIYDPGAVAICLEAGAGARFSLRIGGKCGRASGDPIDLSVTVRGLADSHTQTVFGNQEHLGAGAWVQTDDGIDIVIVSVRSQVYGIDGFEGFGIHLRQKKIVAVKSAQHFYAAFAPIASSVLYVSTAGALSWEFAALSYQNRDCNFWPRVADPFSTEPAGVALDRR